MKRNVERDLLHILKYKNDFDDLEGTLEAILDGTYVYENPYMNEISHDKMMIYLQKVLSLVLNKNISLKNKEVVFKNIDILSKKLSNFKYNDLSKNKIINRKYDRLLENNHNNRKTFLGVVGVFALATVCVISSVKANEKDEDNDYMVIEEKYNDNTINISNNNKEPRIKLSTEEEIEYSYNDESLIKIGNIKEEENNIEETSIVDKILEEYNLTKDEFDVLCAIVMAESKADSYEDAYAVINTIYNRTISERWNSYIDLLFEDGAGKSLYYQAIAPSQFVVYESGAYLDFLGVDSGNKYDAIIKFLLTKEKMHDFLQFRSCDSCIDGAYQFTPDGNNYFDYLDDKIIELTK